MGERLTEKSVVDRSAHPGAMLYVDGEGYVCKANRPKPLSAEEKAQREAKRKAAKKVLVEERAGKRKAMLDARKVLRKSPSQSALDDYQAKVAAYEKSMGRA
jgi:hypothetical protein